MREDYLRAIIAVFLPFYFNYLIDGFIIKNTTKFEEINIEIIDIHYLAIRHFKKYLEKKNIVRWCFISYSHNYCK
jgi:hypothetical protein